MHKYQVESFNLPNGHEVRFIPEPADNGEAYILEIVDGDHIVGRVCSCNGVSRSCPKGTSPHCDCTKNPPVLRCV